MPANFKAELLACFGQPVDENPTGVMQEAGFRELGLNWRYLTIEVPPAKLRSAIEGVRALGMRGLNLTIPHKVAVMQYLDEIAPDAAVIGAVRGQGGRFSVTVPVNSSIRAAIAAIGEESWTPIRYPHAVWDAQLGCWISDAEVAEVEYTAFASKKGQAVTARLIVRRVRDLNRTAAPGQSELFPAWRYHTVFTDSPFELVQAEEQHRDHA